ncbi:MAG: urease accessory protein UreF [Vulcanimicrobiaceae bacterium]
MNVDLASLLVIADGAFPSGAFAHSFGLETAIDEGRVTNEAGLCAWLRTYLLDGLATFDGAALLLALANRASFDELDATLAAATFARSTRTANRRIALALCDAGTTLALGAGAAAADGRDVAAYARAIARDAAFGHPALAYALAFRALRVPAHDAFVAYATTAIGALVSVAARAVPLGQRSAVRTRWSLRPDIARAYDRARTVDDAGGLHAQAYACEIDAMRHAGLAGRMFAS